MNLLNKLEQTQAPWENIWAPFSKNDTCLFLEQTSMFMKLLLLGIHFGPEILLSPSGDKVGGWWVGHLG